MCSQPSVHFLCPSAAGGAGDSERRTRRGGWRRRGAAPGHPQGSAAAGEEKKLLQKDKGGTPLLKVWQIFWFLWKALKVLPVFLCSPQSRLAQSLKQQEDLLRALEEAKKEVECEKETSKRARIEWEREREAMREEITELRDNLRQSCQILKRLEERHKVWGGNSNS